MLYNSITALEVILRKVPKAETKLAVIGYGETESGDPLRVGVGLQRGNFNGDIWWPTPDGDSVFNRWRIAYSDPSLEDARSWPVAGYHPLSKTAEALGSMFCFLEKVIVAGEIGCGDDGNGPEFFRAYEGQKKTKQRDPTCDEADAIYEIFRKMDLAVDAECAPVHEKNEKTATGGGVTPSAV
jgi:hypothetical protein